MAIVSRAAFSGWRLFVSVVVAVGAAHAQRTWIVDRNGGPGVDCTDIQPCINSASPGDRIAVVAPGSYTAFTLTSGLEVEAVAGVRVPGFTISNVPPGQTVRVTGFTLVPSLPCMPAIQITGCAGPVLLGRIVAPWSYGFASRWLSINACGAVLVLDCQFNGGTPYIPFAACPLPVVTVTSSRVCLQRCTLVGCNGVNANGAGLIQAYPGGPALQVTGGEAFLVQTECRGGAGGNGQGCPGLVPAPGATAVLGGPGLLLGSTIIAGPGGTSPCGPAPDGAAITGSFRVTADCTVQGATSGITLIPALTAIRSPGAASLGGLWNLLFTGAPGTILFTGIDVAHAHLPLPGFEVPFLLTPGFMPFVLVTVGGGGSTLLNLPVPMDPTLRGLFLFVQGVALPPGSPAPTLTPVGDAQIR